MSENWNTDSENDSREWNKQNPGSGQEWNQQNTRGGQEWNQQNTGSQQWNQQNNDGTWYGTENYGGNDVYGKPKNDSNGFGVASLVLGIMTLLLFCMCISWITGLLAIIFGIVQLVKSRKKGLAIGGIITGAIGLLLSILLYAGVFLNFSNPGRVHIYDDFYNDFYDDFYDEFYENGNETVLQEFI